MQVVGLTCLVGLTVMTMVQTYALDRQVGSAYQHRDMVQSVFDRNVTRAAHRSAVDGVIHRAQAQRAAILSFVVVSFMLFLFGCREIDDLAVRMTAPGVSRDTLVLGLLLTCSFVISLPSRYYTGRVSGRSGAVYLNRQARILGVAIALGLPVVWGSLFMQRAGHGVWCLYGWAAVAVASVLLQAAYGSVILPRLSPLTLVGGPVGGHVAILLKQVGLGNAGVFRRPAGVWPGDRRILILGLGSMTRILIPETLLRTLEPEEIAAIVAHDLGHRLARHGQLRHAARVLKRLVLLGVIGWLGSRSWLLPGSGIGQAAQPDPTALSFFTALLLLELVSRLLTLAEHAMERHFDLQADGFATGLLGPKALTGALLKLSGDDAYPLTPDPLYSLINDPIPPAALRIARLRETAACLLPVDLHEEERPAADQLAWIGRAGLLVFHGNDIVRNQAGAAEQPLRPAIIVAPARKSRRRNPATAKRVRAAVSAG